MNPEKKLRPAPVGSGKLKIQRKPGESAKNVIPLPVKSIATPAAPSASGGKTGSSSKVPKIQSSREKVVLSVEDVRKTPSAPGTRISSVQPKVNSQKQPAQEITITEQKSTSKNPPATSATGTKIIPLDKANMPSAGNTRSSAKIPTPAKSTSARVTKQDATPATKPTSAPKSASTTVKIKSTVTAAADQRTTATKDKRTRTDSKNGAAKKTMSILQLSNNANPIVLACGFALVLLVGLGLFLLLGGRDSSKSSEAPATESVAAAPVQPEASHTGGGIKVYASRDQAPSSAVLYQSLKGGEYIDVNSVPDHMRNRYTKNPSFFKRVSN